MGKENENTQINTAVRDWLARASAGKLDTPSIVSGGDDAIDVIDPGSEFVLATLSPSHAAGISLSIAQAQSALDDGRWSERDADDRERVLLRLADLIARDHHLLSTLEALDTGKPLADAEIDIAEAEAVLRYYAGWCNKVVGYTIAAPRNLAASTHRGPVGVCVAITPWNYPLPILMYKLAPALAFGNSFIAKPSELAPLSAFRLSELCTEAGIPEGVFSLVFGGGDIGAHLIAQPGIDKIAFTGSTATGRAIMKAAADHPTRVSLELGGKSPQVVFASADIDKAVRGVAHGIWTNAGQVCVAGSRLVIAESIKECFIESLMDYTDTFVIGHALDPHSTMGPIISRAQLAKLEKSVDQAKKSGGRIHNAGKLEVDSGFFMKPTVIDGLASDSDIHQEEVFGPVLAVETFSSEDEAIAKANATRYGLAAGVWTGAAGQGQRVARQLRSGSVWLNTYGIFHPALPFGGTKASGFGRELGASAVEAYSELTTVVEDIAREDETA